VDYTNSNSEVENLQERDRQRQEDQEEQRRNLLKRLQAVGGCEETSSMSGTAKSTKGSELKTLFRHDGEYLDPYTEFLPEAEDYDDGQNSHFTSLPGEAYDPNNDMDAVIRKPRQWTDHPSLSHQTTESSSRPDLLNEALIQWNGDRNEVSSLLPRVSKCSTLSELLWWLT
jgi:hypothetical protein